MEKKEFLIASEICDFSKHQIFPVPQLLGVFSNLLPSELKKIPLKEFTELSLECNKTLEKRGDDSKKYTFKEEIFAGDVFNFSNGELLPLDVLLPNIIKEKVTTEEIRNIVSGDFIELFYEYMEKVGPMLGE